MPVVFFARPLVTSIALIAAAMLALPADAEKADRFKPVNIEAGQDIRLDLANQTSIYSGGVVITKGTMIIRADRIDVRETPDGYYNAVAIGNSGKHATFRQRRDAPNEFMEGDADRLEYDGKSDVIRFVKDASVRVLRGSEIGSEANGNLITYDSATEVISVSGGARPSVTNPGGTVRAVLTPREGSPAALAAAAAAASAAASAPSALRTSPMLGKP